MITQSTNLTKELIEMALLNGTILDIYGQETNGLIRLKYTQRDENAVFRHKLRGTGEKEFAEFDAYCEECKILAKHNIETIYGAPIDWEFYETK